MRRKYGYKHITCWIIFIALKDKYLNKLCIFFTICFRYFLMMIMNKISMFM